MTAPNVVQHGFDSALQGVPTTTATVNATSMISWAANSAGNDLIVMAGSLNITSELGFTISDTLGNSYVQRYNYFDAVERIHYTCHQAKNISAGVNEVSIDYGNNIYPFIAVLETAPATFAAQGEASRIVSTGSHAHAEPGLTRPEELILAFIGSDNNCDWIDADGTPLTGYFRFYDGTMAYRRRYALQYAAARVLTADTIPIDSSINQISKGTALTFEAEAAGPQPPTEDTPIPGGQINATQGVSGSYDTGPNWSVGSGGTLPLTWTQGTSPAWPTGLTISSVGLISWDGSTPPGDTVNLTYDVDDAASNGPTTSTPFTFSVTAAANPPEQISPVTLPTINEGETGNYDASVHFQLGTGGTGPMTYTVGTNSPPWPADLVVATNGTITWTNAVRPGVLQLTLRVEDAANNVLDDSNPFDYVVQGAGILTTAPAKDHQGQAVSGLTDCDVEVFALDFTRVYRETGIAQQGDDTLQVQNIAMTPGTSYLYLWYHEASGRRGCGIGVAA